MYRYYCKTYVYNISEKIHLHAETFFPVYLNDSVITNRHLPGLLPPSLVMQIFF